MEIIKKATPTAPKLMLYSLPGAGKSTLAGKIKNSLFIDIEGGLNYLDVDRTPQITTYDDFYNVMSELYRREKEYDNIVIDSVDWLVRIITEKVAGTDKHNLTETLNKSNGGYGSGKQVLQNEVRTRLIPMLNLLVKKGYGITLIAHADKKELMDSEGYDNTTIAPKVDDTTMNAFVEWCDFVWYLKNVGGERKLVLESDDRILAKNRTGLHGEVSLEDTDINKLLNNIKEK